MSLMVSQITSLTIVYSTVYSGADQRKHQSSASMAFVQEIHRWPVNSPHKGPVMRKMFTFDDVIMNLTWKQRTRIVVPVRPIYTIWTIGYVISSHALVGVLSLIHAGIKDICVSDSGLRKITTTYISKNIIADQIRNRRYFKTSHI